MASQRDAVRIYETPIRFVQCPLMPPLLTKFVSKMLATIDGSSEMRLRLWPLRRIQTSMASVRIRPPRPASLLAPAADL